MNINKVRFIDRYVGAPIVKILDLFSYFRKHALKDPKNILIIKMWGLGSLILTSPTITAIKQKFPNAKLTLLTLESNKGLYDYSNLVDEIQYFPIRNLVQVILDAINFKNRLKKSDLILDIEPMARFTTILTYLIKPSYSIGFDVKVDKNSSIYSKVVSYKEDNHIAEINFKLAKALGIENMPSVAEPRPTPEDINSIDTFLKSNSINNFVVININASDIALERRWSPNNFAAIADYIKKKYNQSVIFIGSKQEHAYVQKCIYMMRFKAINLAGKLNLRELAYLMSLSRLVISNDSGPLHIASAVNAKTLSFYGPETPKLFGPYKNDKTHHVFYSNIECSPCISIFKAKKITCKNNLKCLRSITVNDVIHKLDEILN